MLKVSTFNIQNDFLEYHKSKTLDIFKFLINNKIDILGLQELYSKCNKDLDLKIKDTDYKIYGKYRFFLHFLLKKYNEKVPIITNKNVISNKTYHLPSFPSPLKRIVTKTVISYKTKKISIYNTHLDYRLESVKKRELKKLYNLIHKDENLIILMGDFNLKNNKEIFNDFIRKMEDDGIYRVEVKEKTLKASKYRREIDHIFLSNEFRLIKKEVVKDLEISDHYPILLEIDLNI